MNILFVCTGNTCRSPMAETYLRHLLARDGTEGVQVRSSGVATFDGIPATAEAKFALHAAGVGPPGHASRMLSRDLVDWADRIITMTRSHQRQVCAMFPEVGAKTCTLLSVIDQEGDIYDPMGAGSEVYIKCLDSMKPALRRLADNLRGPDRV